MSVDVSPEARAMRQEKYKNTKKKKKKTYISGHIRSEVTLHRNKLYIGVTRM